MGAEWCELFGAAFEVKIACSHFAPIRDQRPADDDRLRAVDLVELSRSSARRSRDARTSRMRARKNLATTVDTQVRVPTNTGEMRTDKRVNPRDLHPGGSVDVELGSHGV